MIAYVATLLFESEMRFSRSTLHVATLAGCATARAASVLVAANLSVDFGDERNSCNTVTSMSEIHPVDEHKVFRRNDIPDMGFVS